jgi:branched-chain amino acid transport system substrate-binding protein
MTSTDQFDILLQFQLTVMQDLQHRILNAAPLTTLWVKSPLSRRIEQAVPPLEVKACWNKPDVTLRNRGVELSADLNGGARQALSGRILTLDGTVSARQTVTGAVDASQRPYACIGDPTPVQVDLRQLKVSYEGSHWPALLATLNPAKEATALRPVLASQLFGPLARIPLTCMPCSLPLRAPDPHGMVAAGTLPIKRLVPSLIATPASVALGLILDDQRASPSLSVGVIPPQSPYNAAIALSERGLNALLSHLCTEGEASGQMHHAQFGEIEWRWEKLNVKLRQDVLEVSGLLVQQGGVKRAVVAELKSGLVNTGCLQSHIVSSNLDANSAETLLAAWNGVLTILLRARAATAQDQDVRDAERLFQCFALPASTQTIESVAQELLVTDELLIIYYTLPQSVQEVPLEIPPAKPAVNITQPRIPQQTAQGAPVTIELDAQILKDSTPPYDFTWTSDLSPNPIPQFGATCTISSVPVAVAAPGGGLQTLTTAHLKVIDMFGQVAQTQAKAQYLPAPTQKQRPSRGSLASRAGASLPKWLLMALASLLVLASGGITLAVVVNHPAGGGGTPTPSGTIATRPGVTVTVTGVGGGNPPTSGPKIIRIGTDFPTTGKDASGGLPAQNGEKLAVDQANANHTIPGYTLQFDPFNDVGPSGSHDPAVGKANVTQMIGDYLVAGIVGPFNSDVAESEMPVANEAPIALISPSNTFPCLTENSAASQCTGSNDILSSVRPTGNVTYFRIPTTDDHQGQVGAQVIYNTLKLRKVYVVDDAESYGTGLASYFIYYFKQLGGIILGHSSEPASTTSYTALLTSIGATHPDAVYFAGTDATGASFRQQFAQFPALKGVPMVGGDGIVTGDFAAKVAPLLTSGAVWGTTGSIDVTTLPAAQAFITAYQAKYGKLGAYSANAYDCANILIQAIKAAIASGATPPTSSSDAKGAVAFRTAVINALKQTNYQGVTGTTTFDINGDTTNQVVSVFELKDTKSPCDATCWVLQTTVVVGS